MLLSEVSFNFFPPLPAFKNNSNSKFEFANFKGANDTQTKTLRTCSKGHQYYERSDCPTCPICEEERKPNDGFLSLLAAPARRAMENNGVPSLKQLSQFTEEEILKFHGMGKASIPKLKKALAEKGLSFKTN